MMRVLVSNLLLILALHCSASYAQEQAESRPLPDKIIVHLEHLGVIEQLAILCGAESTISAEKAQKFWDIAEKTTTTVEWASQRFNDEYLFLKARDFDPRSNRSKYSDVVQAQGGCNDPLLAYLDQLLDDIKAQIIKDDPTKTELAPWWMILIILTITWILGKAAEFLYMLFGGKLD
jgi:hypothetical protein